MADANEVEKCEALIITGVLPYPQYRVGGSGGGTVTAPELIIQPLFRGGRVREPVRRQKKAREGTLRGGGTHGTTSETTVRDCLDSIWCRQRFEGELRFG